MPCNTKNSSPYLIGLAVTLALLSATPVHADAHAEARHHFEAGATAFEQQRFADAALEFESAYTLEPTWQVLYNLGTVYVALGRPVEAVDAFQRYLQQADTSVDAERRRQVHVEIERQRMKAGWLDIRVNRVGADVRIDGHAAGVTPLSAAVRLAVGVHSVEVSHGEQRFERRDVRVMPAKTTTLEVDFAPLSASAPIAAVPVRKQREKPQRQGGAQRTIGWVFGIAGLAAGAVAVIAIAAGNEGIGSATSAQDRSDAELERRVGFAVVGAGGALVVAGVTSFLFAPSGIVPPDAPHAAVQVSAWASTSSGGLILKHHWQ